MYVGLQEDGPTCRAAGWAAVWEAGEWAYVWGHRKMGGWVMCGRQDGHMPGDAGGCVNM